LPKVKFNQAGKKKRREKKKALGTAQAHQLKVKAVSAKRTKKHQRKVAHRQKVLSQGDAKEQLIAAAVEDLEMIDTVKAEKKAAAKEAKKQRKSNTMKE